MQDHKDPAIRITLLPRDTNSRGTIFGGVILSYIDTAGAIEAHRHTRMERFVTVAMKEVIFHKPVFVGDLVSFYAETVRVGTTSITVRVIVEVERLGKSERVRVTEAEVIYVAVDEKGEKMKISTLSFGLRAGTRDLVYGRRRRCPGVMAPKARGEGSQGRARSARPLVP